MKNSLNYHKPVNYLVLREIFQIATDASLDNWPAPGFFLRSDGIYVKSPEEYLGLGLHYEDVKTLCEHPSGDYTKPALPLPCTPSALYTFLEESGCLDVGDWFDEASGKWVSPVADFLEPFALSTKAPPPKQRAQEERILELIREAGHSPTELPPWEPKKDGAKAEVRRLALKERALFTSKSYDLAWQRLRDDGRIADKRR